jgi:hypothetical protein
MKESVVEADKEKRRGSVYGYTVNIRFSISTSWPVTPWKGEPDVHPDLLS